MYSLRFKNRLADDIIYRKRQANNYVMICEDCVYRINILTWQMLHNILFKWHSTEMSFLRIKIILSEAKHRK